MPEGLHHKSLVAGLMRILGERYPGCWQTFIDGATHEFATPRPPSMVSVRPDLFARHRTTRQVIIGEAKSSGDIDNRHTETQLMEYFDFLAQQPSGFLIMSVPYFDAGTAYRVCRLAKAASACPHIAFEVVGWMFGKDPGYGVWRG